MDLKEYQQKAMRTNGCSSFRDSLLSGGLGITGESGEVADYIKKVVFHGHDLEKDVLAKEIGDVLWYCALLAEAVDMNLDTIAEMNIEKLKKRYPSGFNKADSINRAE